MKTIKNIGLENVQAVYSGPEGDLWELVMGEQIHIGGFQSSMDLAKRAGIGAGMQRIDLCCCSGAGMRFLVKFCGVASMRGVDATTKVVERGRQRCQALGLDKQISFTLANACASGLPSASADFVWGEDAWCYGSDAGAGRRDGVHAATGSCGQACPGHLRRPEEAMTRGHWLGQDMLEASIAPGNLIARKTRFTHHPQALQIALDPSGLGRLV
jgi:hypothetical protein